jgi:hypothetical protein
MGRLIDADVLIAELKESALHHCNNPREDSLLQRDRVIVRAQPTVEAIPKADMVDTLEDLKKEIENKSRIPNNSASAYDWNNGVYACYEVFQQKIDKLKGK